MALSPHAAIMPTPQGGKPRRSASGVRQRPRAPAALRRRAPRPRCHLRASKIKFSAVFFPPLPKAAGKSGFLLSLWEHSRPGGARPISPLTSSHPSPERCSTAKSSVGSRARAPAPRNSSARPRRPRVPEWHIWLMTHCCHLRLPRRGNGRPSLIERPPTQPPRRGKIAGSRRRGGLRQNEAAAEKIKE